MKPTVVYGIEALPITEMDMKRTNTRRMRTYQESWKLHKDLDIIGDIKMRDGYKNVNKRQWTEKDGCL